METDNQTVEKTEQIEKTNSILKSGSDDDLKFAYVKLEKELKQYQDNYNKLMTEIESKKETELKEQNKFAELYEKEKSKAKEIQDMLKEKEKILSEYLEKEKKAKEIEEQERLKLLEQLDETDREDLKDSPIKVIKKFIEKKPNATDSFVNPANKINQNENKKLSTERVNPSTKFIDTISKLI